MSNGNSRVARRDFLKVTAAAGLTAGLSTAAAAKMMQLAPTQQHTLGRTFRSRFGAWLQDTIRRDVLSLRSMKFTARSLPRVRDTTMLSYGPRAPFRLTTWILPTGHSARARMRRSSG